MKIQCFKCGKLGHTSRFCKTRAKPIEEERYDNVREVKKASVVKDTVVVQEVEDELPKKAEVGGEGSSPVVKNIGKEDCMSEDDDDEVMLVEEVNRKDLTKKDTSSSSDLSSGTLASRFAPVDVRTTMDVDTLKDKNKVSGSTVVTPQRRNSIQTGSAYQTKVPAGSGKDYKLFGSSHRDL